MRERSMHDEDDLKAMAEAVLDQLPPSGSTKGVAVQLEMSTADRHRCETCGQVFEPQRRYEGDTEDAHAYEWLPVAPVVH
jgi:uncharacterized OB-fold protein